MHIRRVLALLFLPCVAAAQGPAGARTLTPAAVGESLAVLDQLTPRLTNDTASAPLWYRAGMIAWALSDRARATPEIAGLDWTRLSLRADTSLRIAAQLAPTNSQYRLTVGRFLLMSGVSVTRFASGGFFEDALAIARADTSAAHAHAEAAIEAGRVSWRRYDARANRRIETTPGAAVRSIANAMQGAMADENGGMAVSMKSVLNALENNTMPIDADANGNADYQKSEELFREAYRADPTSPRAFRQVAMVLVEKNRWNDLKLFARERVNRMPWDGWAWMTLGLASHRAADERGAVIAFDSAMATLDAADRKRVDRVERILRPGADTTVLERGDDAERAARHRLFWMIADPLWSKDGNEGRIEFLARLTYAELRWTVEEMYVSGVDSDRGNIYVRYGPPNLIAAFGADIMAGAGDISTVWVYSNGLMFTFNGAPTFATARIPIDDQAYVAELAERMPARWDNINTFKIDSMPTQVTRFRGGKDSVDVFLSAFPPVDKIRNSSGVASPPRADFWLLAGGIGVIYRDSASLTANGVRTWTRRVSPGNYVFRFEATADGANVAARATAPILADIDPVRGFTIRNAGLSDLLLATRAEPKSGANAVRWSDLDIAPSNGTIPFKSALSLVWENYDFGAQDGLAQYQIAVVLQRDRSGAGRLAAKLIGNISGAVGVDRSDDRMVIRFDRSTRHSPAFADFVTVSLEDTPAGSYHLTLEITDKITKRTFARTTSFVIQGK